MPIGAVLGGASIVGSVLGSNSANKNAKRAAQTSADNNAANIALQRESRDMALQRLDPYAARGNAAGGAINALLGLGGSQEMGGPATMPMPTGSTASRYGLGDSPGFMGLSGDQLRSVAARMSGQTGAVQPTAQTTAAPAQSAAQQQQAAFDRFRNSTGYQFRLGEGLDAVNSGYAGAGVLQSGAALRGITEYGQNFASNEFGNYMNALANQQAVGAGAASATAGVSQNFANMATNSNNINAQNQMQAQLSRQNPLANALGTYSGIGLGFLGGGN